ncbi:MAG: DEAD/DEAH box helicase [Candidatus Woesearchaeota archaeon]
MNFYELGLSDSICQKLEQYNITEPTRIQEQVISQVLKGRDILAQSATGSGKTIAFGGPIIDMIGTNKQPMQALILAPTRELAEQIKQSLQTLTKIPICTVYGGVGYQPQIDGLRRSPIVVATPGRFIDLLEQGHVQTENLKQFVLDEADRMLDMGFFPDIEKIISYLPEKKFQAMCFSATYPPQITGLTKKILTEPFSAKGTPQVDPTKLKQYYYEVPQNLKFSLLVHLLEKEHAGSAMVFTNSKRMADMLASQLKTKNIKASAIHGGLTQAKRKHILEQFQKQKTFALICTDVAARGLDIPDVSHVYNYDIPADSKQYIHRIGRTARAGKDGMAVSILAQRDYENFDKILQFERVKVDVLERPYLQKEHLPSTPSRDSPRGGDRQRGSRRPPQRSNNNRGSYRRQSNRR